MTAVLLALTACDPEAEGCLDYRAVAIDVTADVACDDCCRYPSLRLQVVPGRLQADTFVREAAPMLIVDGDTLRATRLPTYLSDFALELADGSLYPLTDTLTVVGREPGIGAELLDVSVGRTNLLRGGVLELGSVLEALEVVALRARLGPPAELSELAVDLQPTESTLAGDADSLLVTPTGQLAAAAFNAERPDSSEILLRFIGEGVELRWALPTPTRLPQAFNLLLTLGVPVDGVAELAPLAEGVDAASPAVLAQATLQRARVLEVGLQR